jgi:phosphatidyl-myo-inositol dimannoside synthase
MILALVTDAFGASGGIAQYNRDFLVALSKNWRIEVLPRNGHRTTSVLPRGIMQHRANMNRFAYSLSVLAKVFFRRPAIVFCGHLYMSPLAALLAIACGAKLVIQMHGIEAWTCPNILQRWAVSKAKMVLCVSRYTREQVLEWCEIPHDRVFVLPNTVGDAFVPGDRAAARTKFGLRDEQVLLSVGRLDARERYKGHELVIELLAGFVTEGRNISYLIAGEGDDRPRLEALARNRNIANHVRFLGAVEEDRLPELYRAADVFILPSTGEGFGIVFLEAMACGTTVLGLDIAGAKDALADGQLGIVASRNDLLSQTKRALEVARGVDATQVERAARGRFGRSLFADRADRLMHVLTK